MTGTSLASEQVKVAVLAAPDSAGKRCSLRLQASDWLEVGSKDRDRLLQLSLRVMLHEEDVTITWFLAPSNKVIIAILIRLR